jgi:uncharacterized SAM-binding protein YcdF (DUF218 family)
VIDLLALVGGIWLAIAYTPLANFLVLPLSSTPSKPTKSDVIVILSGGRYLDGSLNDEALWRTMTGVRLYQQGLAPRLLFTGGPCCGQSASALMSNLAAELGVPKSAILLEEQSLRTSENAIQSAAILRMNGMRSAILVTSPLHMRRAQLAFEHAGVSVYPVRAEEKNLWLLSGAVERLTLFQAAIHEYLGLAFYRIRGWT